MVSVALRWAMVYSHARRLSRVAQSRVGTKGGHERLLQAVLRRIGADAADQEPMELGRVVVHQALKRRQAHTS